MKKKTVALLVLGIMVLLLLSSCFTTPVAATSNPVGKKIGSARCLYLLSILPLGNWDTGVYKAAKNGGISKISTVDRKVQFFYLVSIFTTVVTGE
jgi:NADH:ubiquinone oxidoreductase subunit 2 (subunit N)